MEWLRWCKAVVLARVNENNDGSISTLTIEHDGNTVARGAAASGLARVQSVPNFADLNIVNDGIAPNAAVGAGSVGMRISNDNTQAITNKQPISLAIFRLETFCHFHSSPLSR